MSAVHAGSKVPACRNWIVGDALTANLADVDCIPCRVHHGLRLDRGEAAAPMNPDQPGRPIFGQKEKKK